MLNGYSCLMVLFYLVMGLIMGGFIWFFITIILEEPVGKKIKEKKFGKDSTKALTKADMQGFYVLSALVSALLGLIIGYLGSQGKL
jgi:hypothetical protein